jgi:FkbM family methyltransferase
MPKVRGRGRLVGILNAALLRLGADPVAQAQMMEGHRLWVDCRVFSHCHAYFSGTYDDDKISALLSFLRQGGVALDVGANIGFHTVPMALFASKLGAHVVAIEPVSFNLLWLHNNLVLNDCLNYVDIRKTGLSDKRGKSEIVLSEDFSLGAKAGTALIADSDMFGPEFKREVIELETLDHLWESVDGRLDVIKLDIEGHEANCLKGGKQVLAMHRPVLLIEVCRFFYQKRGLDFDSVIASMLPNEYVFGQVRKGDITPIASLACCVDTDVLAMPRERVQVVSGRIMPR